MNFEEFAETTLLNLENIFKLIEIILLGYLGRKVRNVSASGDAKTVTNKVTSSLEPSPSPAPVDVPKPKSVKKDLQKEILADIDLLFSGKSDADLSEDEKERVSALISYLEGRSHEV